MAKTIDSQTQDIVVDLNIATDGATDEVTITNTSEDLWIYAGDVRIFDESGEITIDTRGDRFDIDIQANEKNSLMNAVMDVRALKTKLTSPNFPGFEWGKDSRTKFSLSHTYTGASPVGNEPFNVRITFFGEPLANRSQRGA